MGFSPEYWYSFHYSDSRGYLIFCCHGVARYFPMGRNIKEHNTQLKRKFNNLQAIYLKMIALNSEYRLLIGRIVHLND